MSLTKYVTRYASPITEEEVEGLLVRTLRNVQIYKPCNANVIYVTEAVQPCMRKAYFDRLHPQPPSVPAVLGEFLHNLLQKEFKAQGCDVEVGVGLDLHDFKLVGRVDAIHEDEDGSIHVIEIKTVGRFASKSLRRPTFYNSRYTCSS